MNATTTHAHARPTRALMLAGSAFGALLVPFAAQAQNVSANTNADYALTETGTRSGGPRTVDVTTSGGNIALSLGTIQNANSSVNNGAAIAATNTGSGDITISANAISATGTALSYGVDARAQAGDVHITTGTIDSSSNPNSRGISAISAGGAITINADVTNGGLRGIFTGSNGGVFPTSTTITSNVATANGTNQVNAIIAQGDSVNLTSGIARLTNANAAGGTGLYINSGDATVRAGTTEALGNNQAGIWAYADRTLNITSDVVNITQTSYGFHIFHAGDLVIDSGTVTSTGGYGATGIYVATITNSAKITSDTISTLGRESFGIWFDRSGGDLTIDSGTITTGGNNSHGINIVGATGTTKITSDTITTAGSASSGISVASTGAIAIDNTGSIATQGANAFGIDARSTIGAITINSDTVRTVGLGAQGIWAQTTDGDIAINAGTTITTAAGSNTATGATQDAVFGYASGAGAVTVVSDHAETAGDYATAVGAVGGGKVTITSNVAKSAGFQLATVYGSSRNSDVTINATDSAADGVNAYAVEGHAANGALTITSGAATAAHGNAIYGTAGGLVTINATTAVAHGDGGTGVAATGGSVALNIGSASSDGGISVNQSTGMVYRGDAVFAEATSGTIDATIGNATATGAGSDAVHLLANGANGAVTVRITGAASAANGTGLWIDPPGNVNVAVAAGASVSGLTAIDVTAGGTNTIINAGTISGSFGPAILASGKTVLDNSGTLAGGPNSVVVELGASDDQVILRTGSIVNGTIYGGGGTDGAVLIGTGNAAAANQTVAAFSGFDSLAVQSGYWTAGATSGAFSRATIGTDASLELVNGGAGIAGITTPSIVSNGTLVVRSGADAGSTTFGDTIVTGTGGVRFTGTGTATLDGTNSLANSGANTVDAGAKVVVTGSQNGSFVNNGIFQIGTGGTTGTFIGDLVDNGTLIVNRSDAYSFVGVLSGSGIFVKEGTGTITFGTGYAFTGTTVLNGGGIKLTGAVAETTELAVEGNGTVDFSGTDQTVAELAGTSKTAGVNIAGGSLTVNQDTNSSFAGSISGDGGFTKTGSGSLNFTGNSTYTGSTTVDEGRLAVNGSIVSPLTVNTGGTLGGTGSLGNTVIGSGGTWAPGNSIGTQTVIGNLAFAKGSVFAVEVDAAGNADRVNATGSAAIQGGTVQVLAGAGTYAQLTNYTILSAAGGLTGKFDTVTSNFAFLTPFLNYATDRVTLSLVRNDISFTSAAVTANQGAVALAVNSRGFGDALYNAALVQSGASARATFDGLSGELHASLGSELIDGGRRVRDAVLARGLVRGDGIGMWAQALQVYANSRAQDGLGDLSSNRSGVIGGVDFATGSFRFGINGGYVDSDVTVGDRASNAEVKTRLAGASLAWQPEGAFGVQLGGNYAWHDIDTRRVLGTVGIAGTIVGETDAHSAQVFGEVGYDVIEGALDLGLFARVAHDWTDVDAFAETGGAAALTVDSDSRQTSSASAGFRFGGSAPVSAGLSLAPRVSLAYQHAWGDLSGSRNVRFATGSGFGVSGASLGKDALDVDLGLDLVTDAGLRFGIGGFANASREWSDYGGKASISLRF
ncbi:hypothetical protein E5A73_05510 [Sphingomonas gei]|uniref:Autotransporter domain-containing protein n=1 Tax=Sphingomonas gei TaxID=1395960 RepID=A0A4V6RBE7_9SPHN|nr:autotransporter domain-containing protein [Sphingomonas gei]TGX54902.1 hypothetical protein E5A73_05510 [Sphingomonas gei]